MSIQRVVHAGDKGQLNLGNTGDLSWRGEGLRGEVEVGGDTQHTLPRCCTSEHPMYTKHNNASHLTMDWAIE